LLEDASDTLTHPGLLWPKLHSLVGVGRLADARAAFRQALHGATLPVVVLLARAAPQLFENSALATTLATLLERVQSLEETPHEEAVAEQLLTTKLRLLLALKNFDAFLETMEHHGPRVPPDSGAVPLRAVATALRRTPRLDYARRKVFGIGLSRTGTTSLATALEGLGYFTAHWSNPLTDQILDEDDLHLFDAFTDTPVCVGFEKSYYQFPNSKFIYTTRDVAAWEQSWLEYFRRRWGCGDFREALERIATADRFEYGRRFVDMHRTLYFNHSSYAEAYRTYDRRIRAFFADKPAERFLILDICAGEGWNELCRFLGDEVPNTPFPWHNRSHAARDERHA
jgi:hypothetical protein